MYKSYAAFGILFGIPGGDLKSGTRILKVFVFIKLSRNFVFHKKAVSTDLFFKA
jgi:hypothetical protein